MNRSIRTALDGPKIIGTLRDGRPVWSIAGGAGDDEPPTPDESLTIEVPEDLSELDDEALEDLRGEASQAFDELRDRAEELDDAGMAALEAIADEIVRIGEEQEARVAAREERANRADELAQRVHPPAPADDADDDDGDEPTGEDAGDAPAGEDAGDEPAGDAPADESVEEPVAAGTRPAGPITINLSGIRQRQDEARRTPDTPGGQQMPRTRMVAADGTPGLTAGAELDVDALSEVLSTRLEGVTISAYENAFKSGERIQTRLPAALIKREVPDELRVGRPGNDTQEVITAAVNRWKGEIAAGDVGQLESLTAAAWCAPSTPIYDLCEIETTDGGISLPGITVERGGVQNTTGPDFSEIFANSGFCFTSDELDAQSPPGSGPKPCYTVSCPEFTESRLGVCGTCIRAGLLQNRAFPELVQRTVRGAMVTHAHDVWGNHIANIIAGSTAVSMPAGQAGAAAPILQSIELQVEHFRYVNRASDTDLLEAVFPRYVRGMIRSDLSRRLGVNLLDVDNGMISDWFAQRGVAAQFVVNFDDITGAAGDFTAWPDQVRFLLYAPGTWVAGTAEVIRIDTLFDSALLAQNDFTALFFEEGLLTLKTCPDSRVVTVPVNPDGATHGGIDIDGDGTEVVTSP